MQLFRQFFRSSLRNFSDMSTSGKEVATFAAGCFWGVELAFQRMPGVDKTAVGYTQGHTKDPTYRQICTGSTGHAESVQVVYNPTEVSYDDLLQKFWEVHDPTQFNRQKNDIGTQYRSGIYYHTEEQKNLAEQSKEKQQANYTDPIVTEIKEAKEFYVAEEAHQRYLEKGGQCASKGCNDSIRCYG